MTMKQLLVVISALGLIGATGCASKSGNVALGAAGAGAAYEVSNDHQINQLDKDLKDGKISQDEHDRRVQEIKKRSIVH